MTLQPPRNDNAVAQRTELSRLIERAAADMKGIIRDMGQAIDSIINELVAPSGFIDHEHRLDLDALLQSGLHACMERYITSWRDRLDAHVVDDVLDLLVYSAAATLGRQLAHQPGLAAEDEPRLAETLLGRAAEFASLFGKGESWNGVAAARYFMRELAVPLGMVERDAGGPGQPGLGIAVIMDAMTELLSRVGCGVIAILLGRPLPIPLAPSSARRWADLIDGPSLGRALERALAGDALVTTLHGGTAILADCIMNDEATWLLTCPDVYSTGQSPARAPRSGEVRDTAQPAGARTAHLRIDRMDHARVHALMSDGGPNVDNLEPDLSIALPCAPGSEAHARIALRSAHGGASVLLALGAGIRADRAQWAAWLIPTDLEPAAPARASPPSIHHNHDEAAPPGTTTLWLPHQPRLVAGDCVPPLIVLGTKQAVIADVEDLARDRGDRSALALPWPDPAGSIEAAYSLSIHRERAGTHLAVVGARCLRIYEGGDERSPWWNQGELRLCAELTLLPHVGISGVAHDLLVFCMTPDEWAFFPLAALLRPDARMLDEARGVLFASSPVTAKPDADARLPAWVRPGEPHDLCIDGRGLLSMTFAGSPWTHLYEHGHGDEPRHIGLLKGMDGTRPARTAHARLPVHGGYLIVRARSDYVEYRML